MIFFNELLAVVTSLNCGTIWKTCEMVPINGAAIRAGYVEESKDVAFRGNIIYFEGLADSLRNHDPLFSRLATEGYRVIAFDYMGQGGSEGKMDNTRIADIPRIGAEIWKRYALNLEAFPKRTIIGWSTGGLAAYYAASAEQAERVILIAPGISPKTVLKITSKSLSTAWNTPEYKQTHPDKISPGSPAYVFHFSNDLLKQAAASRGAKLHSKWMPMLGTKADDLSAAWVIPSSVKGLVLLSDSKDKYVNAETTSNVVETQTEGRFEIIQYPKALHEIDNEILTTAEKLRNDIVEFLKRTD